jgi:hypothetical protein
MIIREKDHEYILIPQHNHAFLSGELAKHFKKDFFKSKQCWEEVILAVYEHDRAWIRLDRRPLWNEQEEAPYSFANYPLKPKLQHYKIGLDEIQEISIYAALLCSMHYCSFFFKAKDHQSLKFLVHEEKRQKQIKEKMKQVDIELLHQHFRLLQICDNISLYVCLNEPGSSKENEHPWFKRGFNKSECFNNGKAPLYSYWLDQTRISLAAFPFVKPFQANLEYRAIPKVEISAKGLEKALTTSMIQRQTVRFVPTS